MNALERSCKKIYRFSSYEDAHFKTTAGSVFILFNLWFQTMHSQKFSQFFLGKSPFCCIRFGRIRILLRLHKMPAFFTPTPAHVGYHDSCQLLKHCIMKNQNKCKMKFIINCTFCKTCFLT